MHFTSGVPRHSYFGPFIFTPFINDLPSVIFYAYILMYADDVKPIFLFTDSLHHSQLYDDLNAMKFWCSANQLHLNCSQCMFLAFNFSLPYLVNYTMDNTP